jgi:ankyrin repeat protein
MSASGEYYRRDGVRITHDPYSPEMAEKYGLPGETDNEGFDPYADTVGPGIYGGIVKRDENGEVMIGQQYQNHNPNPGPIYAGGGYTPTIKKLQSTDLNSLAVWLSQYPDLVNEITTGGARPLHMAGMSKRGELVTSLLLENGADMNATDSYGFKPIHRMASNNLAIGIEVLISAGADPLSKTTHAETPMQIARSSRAFDVIRVLIRYVR